MHWLLCAWASHYTGIMCPWEAHYFAFCRYLPSTTPDCSFPGPWETRTDSFYYNFREILINTLLSLILRCLWLPSETENFPFQKMQRNYLSFMAKEQAYIMKFCREQNNLGMLSNFQIRISSRPTWLPKQVSLADPFCRTI